MGDSVRKYCVFIASPVDVAKERQIAREVVLSLSHRLGTYGGFVLEPVGWETHAEIDIGRPQALINPLVRECDVFVGILWSRFGTASGVAESGTAEEFVEAEQVRRQTGDHPTFLVFFSDISVPKDRLRTAGGRAQLDRVLAFEERFENERVGLSERYGELHEFERKLREQLESWCAKRFGARRPDLIEGDTSALRTEYLAQLVNFHKDLPVAGFETNLRIPISLENVFVPLRARIAAFAGTGRTETSERPELGGRDDGVRDFNAAWLFAAERQIRLLAILGQPGAGKTTLLKHLLLVCASGRASELGLPASTLPVFVPLRRLSTGDDFALALQAASEPLVRGLPPNFLGAALDEESCLLLLDGLDEVADPAGREEVSRWIEALAARFPRTRIVVTARFAGYRDAPLRVSHLELAIERFREPEIRRFLAQWYRAVEVQLNGDTADVVQRADEVAGELSRSILEHEEIRMLAANPLLLQIIALVHRDRGALPKRRVELYEECTNVLLEHWDRAKGLETKLSAREARQILQPVALWMHAVEHRTRASERDLLPVVAEHCARLPRPIDAVDLLRSVRDRSGLLTGHGVDEYGF